MSGTVQRIGVIKSPTLKKMLLALVKNGNSDKVNLELLGYECGITRDRVLKALESLQAKTAIVYKILPNDSLSLQYLNSDVLRQLGTYNRRSVEEIPQECKPENGCPHGGACWTNVGFMGASVCVYGTSPIYFKA